MLWLRSLSVLFAFVHHVQSKAFGSSPWSQFDYSVANWPPSVVGTPIAPQVVDQELASMIAEIDPIQIQYTIANLTNFGTRHTSSNQTDPVRGIGAARSWLTAKMQEFAAPSQGRMTVDVPCYIQPASNKSRILFPTNICNVVARINGTGDPNRVYVITGHYDSRRLDIYDYTGDAPGADDNASGVAGEFPTLSSAMLLTPPTVVMELARICATKQPYATMIFAAVAGEEQALLGATFLAQTLANASANVEANFNNDIVGTGSNEPYDPINNRTIRLFGAGTSYLPKESASQVATRIATGGENDTPARNLGRFVSEINDGAANYTGMQVALIYRPDRYERGGDHEAFLGQVFPSVRFTEPLEDFKHQHQNPRVQDGVAYGDNLSYVDFAYTGRVASVNLAAMWSIANAPRMPRNVTISVIVGEPAANTSTPPDDLLNTSLLQWLPSDEPVLESFEVVWRPFSQQQWQYSLDVGNVTSALINVSKDNVLFGVRAVGNNGKKSPAVYPFPADD